MKKTTNILSEFANHKSDAVNIECSEFEKLKNDFGDYQKSITIKQENKFPTALDFLINDGFESNDGLSIELCALYMGKFLKLHTAPLREELEKLRAENERLENLISGYTSSLKDYDVERKHLIDENQKLRETLGQVNVVIANEDYYMDWSKTTNEIENIVLGALKGDSDEA